MSQLSLCTEHILLMQNIIGIIKADCFLWRFESLDSLMFTTTSKWHQIGFEYFIISSCSASILSICLRDPIYRSLLEGILHEMYLCLLSKINLAYNLCSFNISKNLSSWTLCYDVNSFSICAKKGNNSQVQNIVKWAHRTFSMAQLIEGRKV